MGGGRCEESDDREVVNAVGEERKEGKEGARRRSA